MGNGTRRLGKVVGGRVRQGIRDQKIFFAQIDGKSVGNGTRRLGKVVGGSGSARDSGPKKFFCSNRWEISGEWY